MCVTLRHASPESAGWMVRTSERKFRMQSLLEARNQADLPSRIGERKAVPNCGPIRCRNAATYRRKPVNHQNLHRTPARGTIYLVYNLNSEAEHQARELLGHLLAKHPLAAGCEVSGSDLERFYQSLVEKCGCQRLSWNAMSRR